MDNGVAIHKIKIKKKNYFAFTVLLSKQTLTERERRTLVRRGTEVVGVQVLMRVKNERAKYWGCLSFVELGREKTEQYYSSQLHWIEVECSNPTAFCLGSGLFFFNFSCYTQISFRGLFFKKKKIYCLLFFYLFNDSFIAQKKMLVFSYLGFQLDTMI